ncbi:MAG: SH3 domain-containing protein, partial [Lachnospiraceae bacterium]|nr:SH3 domain-containing protein [Lachnospiraceae bacterium]
MKKRVWLAGLAAAAVFSFVLPAAAETFTSSDGVLSIELPNDSWKEMTDPMKWIVLSDGSNMITVDHLSNGEKLPEMSVADDHYVNVYQAVFSTQNEVFIITGSVVDAAKIPEVANAIVSAKVLKYDTKMKIAPASQTAAVSEYSVVATDVTKYVTSDGLNVRMGCSTTDQIIGAYAYGSAVRVTGVIQRNGEDFGWYQVDYNGGTGYVSSAYLSDTAPAAKTETKNDTSSQSSSKSSGLTFTGTATTVYAMSGTAVTIYQATDGNWYDANGTLFTWITEGKLSNAGGDSFTTNKPASTSENGITPVNSITVYWLNGNAETLTQYSDGNYYSSDWVMYFDAGGGAFAGVDGTTLYTSQPQLGTAGSSLQHGLQSQGSRRPV